MLGSKRAACLDRPDVKLVKEDALSVYESTFLKLRLAKASAKKPSGGSREEAQSCLCRPEKVASLVTKMDTTIPIPTCQGATSLLACSARQENPGIPEDDGPLCFHCRRKTCARCRRQCAQCEEEFCSVCSIMDFSERYDRAFCLDCYSSNQMAASR